jgi:hypothetical protein
MHAGPYRGVFRLLEGRGGCDSNFFFNSDSKFTSKIVGDMVIFKPGESLIFMDPLRIDGSTFV